MAKRDTLNAVFLCPHALSEAGYSVYDLKFSERMIMKYSVVWDMTPCSLVEMY